MNEWRGVHRNGGCKVGPHPQPLARRDRRGVGDEGLLSDDKDTKLQPANLAHDHRCGAIKGESTMYVVQKKALFPPVALLLIALLGACGGSGAAPATGGNASAPTASTNTTASQETTEVSFMGWGNDQERELYANMFKQFEAKNPGYKV